MKKNLLKPLTQLSLRFKEMAGTDAAADEMKAIRLTRYTRLKNFKVRVRDGAHAAGRCLGRVDESCVTTTDHIAMCRLSKRFVISLSMLWFRSG